MSSDRYVAYVGTYTHGNSVGIHLYDVDEKKGVLTEQKVVPINNPSDLTISKDGKFLYSIADEGVEAFKILPDGDLESINKEWIGGMRGCSVAVDDENRYLFVGGFHDGRVTMMRLNEDGSIGGIADGIFHQGLGRAIAERSYLPHVTCVMPTPVKQHYLCAVDSGLDQVKIYQLDYEFGTLKLADILRLPLDSEPRMIRFTKDGKFAYVLCGLTNTVEVYRFECTAKGPVFEHIQSISTTRAKERDVSEACDMKFSEDEKHLYCSNAGINTVMVFDVDEKTGMLSEIFCSAISGDYPKTLGIFPDGEHFVSLNHDSNEITTFKMDYEKRYFLMEGKTIQIDTPNCIYIHKLG